MKTRMRRLPLPAFCLLLAGILLPGCAGYRLGSTLPAHIRSVHVPMAVNQTLEPDIESVVTRAIRQEFQRDGTLDLQDADRADTSVEVVIKVFRTEPIVYARDDRVRAEEFRLLIGAEVRFVDHAEGRDRLHATLLGEATFPAPSGDISGEVRGAIEPAARDLAREIVTSIITAW